tara:strand:+ start:1164 stop:1466 length:303 start_codon:yes stop_codon:yes gene_type:complete
VGRDEVLGRSVHGAVCAGESADVEAGHERGNRRPHGIWFKETGNVRYTEQIQEGHVIVTDTSSTKEAGQWGSTNAMGMIEWGVVGIITDGYCRDTAELKI